MTEFITTILLSAGLSSALIAALGWLGKTWISERIKLSIKHEYDQELASISATLQGHNDAALAELNGTINREAEKLRLASHSFGEAQRAIIAKRLHAMDETWRTILLLHDAIPDAMSFLDYLLTSEYLDAHQKPFYKAYLDQLDHFSIIKPMLERSRKLAELRPYIGEYLWALFGTYQAVLQRAIYLIGESKSEPSKRLWHSDRIIRDYIQTALGESALAEFDGKSSKKVSWIMNKFTQKIIQVMEGVVAGKDFGDAALKQANQMAEQIMAARFPTP